MQQFNFLKQVQVSDLARLLEDGTKVKNILKSSHLSLIL